MGLNLEHAAGLSDNSHPDPGADREARRQEVLKILNHTLSTEAVLTLKTRSAHWNASGPGFLDRHALFDDQYKQLNAISDKIALRSRELGGFSVGSFEEFLNQSKLKDQPGEVPGLDDLLTDHQAAIRFLQEDAIKCLQEYEDEGTGEFLAGIQRLHEQMACKLRSYMVPRDTIG